MNGFLIVCTDCLQPVEGVLLPAGIWSYRATPEMADSHLERWGHWPERVHIHEANTTALRRVGGRR